MAVRSKATVSIEGAGATNNVVNGNYIGVNRSNVAVANGGDGVQVVDAANTSVGSGAGGTGNIISGNAGNGVLVSGIGATGTVIMGNPIGTDASVVTIIANGLDGIRIQSGASGTVIGEPFGNPVGGGNVVSGNLGYGLSILSGANTTVVVGNSFGADANG